VKYFIQQNAYACNPLNTGVFSIDMSPEKQVDLVIGTQRGDEGKGIWLKRLIELDLGSEEPYAIVARGNGGANAGHTLMIEGQEPLATHQLPSGIIVPGKRNVIGNGVYLDPVAAKQEIYDVRDRGFKVTHRNLSISDTAHVVMPHHILMDELSEKGEGAQGSTQSGIRFVASEKYLRDGLRVEDVINKPFEDLKKMAHQRLREVREDVNQNNSIVDVKPEYLSAIEAAMETKDEMDLQKADIWAKSIEFIKPFVNDTNRIMREYIADGRRALVEGAQSSTLDINNGMYPYVTSSHTDVNGLLSGLGLSHKAVGTTYGVMKGIKSHVGGGPFVTEIKDKELAARLRGEQGQPDSEFGSTTGRPRRMGWLDLVEVNAGIYANGVDKLLFSKLDHMTRYGAHLMVAKAYNFNGGEISSYAPNSANKLEGATPLYTFIDTWQTHNISNVRSFYDLPASAKSFIEDTENFLQTPIIMAGVGPRSEQVIDLSSRK
jgi:adenylosuccinate synthase